MDNSENIKQFEGSKKGGGAPRPAQEAPNTLRSSAQIKVVEVLSEGEIVGLLNGAKSIYLNDTPLQNSDDSYNFENVIWDSRVGLPSQAYMPGFPSVEAEITVNAPVTYAASVTRTTTAPNIDAMRVTILFPQGLSSQNTTNGDLNGATVQIAIDKKLSSSGTWVQDIAPTITDKCVSAAEVQYRIERPSGSGTWDVRVRRLTADSTSAALNNATTWSRLTEIQDVKLEYENTAYVGIGVDAQSVGGQVPVRSYEIKGIKVRVPTNYDPATRAYTGQWNGTFKTAWTDNPAWILFDLITNTRYGMGDFIADAQVDHYSFYNAAVYNDELVPDGKGGYEPRFTASFVINNRGEALKLIQNVASVMRAYIVWAGGLVTLIQDRPSSPVKLITKANVIDGRFTYKSSTLQERFTAVNVTYNDKTDRYLQRVVTVEDSAGIARYGYNSTDIAAFGATTEGQAIRYGKWYLDTVLNQLEIVTYKASLNQFDLMVGEVIKLYDEDYTGVTGAGRIGSGSTRTSIVLDRAVTLTAGSTIDVLMPDGKTIETSSITQTSGSYSTVTVSPAFSLAPTQYSDFIVKAAVSPRQFKIANIRQEEPNIITVEAIAHDPNKYARVETGISVPAPIFSAVPSQIIGPPQTLTFREIGVNVDNTIKRALLTSWTPSTTGITASYKFRYRVNSGEWTTVDTVPTISYQIDNAIIGTYDVEVYAVSATGLVSPATTGSYTIDATAGTGSTLNPVTDLIVVGGGTSFNGPDINFQWTNPASNSSVLADTLRDFEVKFIETVGSTIVRSVYVPAVAAGSIQTFSYTFSMNVADGGPRRSVRVEVRCRDTNNKTSNVTTATFTNPAPATPSNLVVSGGLKTIKVTYDRPTELDWKGTLIWMSTSNGFTPSASNLVYDGSDTYVSLPNLSDVTTYYLRVAAYDSFGKSNDGSGLNVSAQQSTSTSSGAGIPMGSATPGTGTEGDLFFNTTDGKLYRYHAGAWTTAVPAVDITGTLTNAQIADLAAAKLTGQITGTQITDGAISTPKLAAGSVTTAKLTANAVTANEIAAGAITTTKLAANAVTANEIATNAITSDKILANAITAGKINAAAVSTNELATNAVSADKIVANAITSDKIAADAVTANKIAAGSISTTKLAAGAVTADKIAAGSITANEIASGTITASRLKILPEGINPDPNFNDPVFWDQSTSNGWYLETNSSVTSNLGVGTAAVLWSGASPGTQEYIWASRKVPFSGVGQTLRVRARAYNSSNRGLWVGLLFYNAAGTYFNSNLGLYWAPGTGTTTKSGQMVIPSGTAYISFYITCGNAGTAFSGIIGIGEFKVDGAAEADLLVDGTIAASKMQVGTITAASGIIADAAITTAKIANLAVSTLKIQDYAVTAPVAAYSMEQRVNNGDTYPYLHNLWVTISDAPNTRVVITVSGIVQPMYNTYGSGDSGYTYQPLPAGFKIYNASTGALLYNLDSLTSTSQNYGIPEPRTFSATVVDVPGNGSFRYDWRGYGGFYITSASMVCFTARK